MWRVPVPVALLLGALAGCATPAEPPEIRYLPPDGAPPQTGELRLPRSERLVWNQLLGGLQQSPLTVERADRQAGLIVTTYEGDPEPYVDCGWIMAYSPQNLVRTPATAAEAIFDRSGRAERLSVKRRLGLNGRLVVQVQPVEAGTLLSVDSTYVLTKALEVAQASGQPQERSYEIISFTTAEQGRFASGTVCHPTGELERLAAGAVAAAGTRGVPAAPQIVLDCAAADAPFCEARELIAEFEEANRRQDLGLALTTVGGATLFDGDPLALDVSFPNYASFLHVAYIQRSGVVGHILPGGGRLWPANAQNYVERTGYDIAPPYGVELILALATEKPLFVDPRPEFEAAEVFLAALRRRLAEVTTTEPGTRIAASHVLVTTETRGVLAAASY
jgi:hypothetical protein